MDKVYAFSDIHGMYELWKQIDEFCDETDKIIFLGDAADRGPEGLKIIEELLADKRVTYLKGNHEDILVRVGVEILEGRTSSIQLWYENDGAPTVAELLKKTEDEAWDLIYKLNKLPEVCEYTNKQGKKIILSHAGCPIIEVERYEAESGIDYLWDRDHLIWDIESEVTDDMPIIIHGHTPVPLLFKYGVNTNGIYSLICEYCGKHKIDIDLACFATKRIALLDLDTLEPIYFEGESEDEIGSH
jgi:serine/threonine protein phosphatase 1